MSKELTAIFQQVAEEWIPIPNDADFDLMTDYMDAKNATGEAHRFLTKGMELMHRVYGGWVDVKESDKIPNHKHYCIIYEDDKVRVSITADRHMDRWWMHYNGNVVDITKNVVAYKELPFLPEELESRLTEEIKQLK